VRRPLTYPYIRPLHGAFDGEGGCAGFEEFLELDRHNGLYL